jgi:hypothetical protein
VGLCLLAFFLSYPPGQTKDDSPDNAIFPASHCDLEGISWEQTDTARSPKITTNDGHEDYFRGRVTGEASERYLGMVYYHNEGYAEIFKIEQGLWEPQAKVAADSPEEAMSRYLEGRATRSANPKK